VRFPCHTKLIEDVNWARLDTPESEEEEIYLGGFGYRDLGHDPRFMVLDKSLVIYNVTVGDSGYYRCVEDAGLGNKHYHRLTVEGEFVFAAVVLTTQFHISVCRQIRLVVLLAILYGWIFVNMFQCVLLTIYNTFYVFTSKTVFSALS